MCLYFSDVQQELSYAEELRVGALVVWTLD